ncbi:hypothetical protein SEPCBS119000_002918 [Sporothrix epigloea]|uniref:tetrahydrofolate synthase n=1 Tax=Sporothrix epigloea TaxID=1892477 RepID=A0ABP0DK10_9PEZI
MASLSTGVRYDTSKALDYPSLPRTYESALKLLSLLPTNRDVTSLFEMPRPKSERGEIMDWNSMAIPEVIAWMARAGYGDLPRDLAPLRCIHVAGTKGKGSVSAFATAILVEEVAAGNETVGRVGTYLSPHVVSVRERIWLDGRPISRGLFTKYVFELWARLSEAAAAADPAEQDPYGAHTKPFYFRFLTLLAFHVFLREGVHSAVIECGIGGEYDATNVLPASSVTAAVVTRLGIDHVAMLGRTLSQIAWHKAGIFKPGVAAIALQPDSSGGGEKDNAQTPPGESLQDHEEAFHIVCTRAFKKSVSALYELSPQAVRHWGGVPDAALMGAFQKYNMALAAVAVDYHIRFLCASDGASPDMDSHPFDLTLLPETFTRGLAKATLRGRCESILDESSPTGSTIGYLVDGAHTADSLGEIARYFVAQPEAETSSHRVLLFTVRDREPGDLVRALVAGIEAGIDAGRGGQTRTTKADGYFNHAVFVFPPEAEAARKNALVAMQQACPATKACVCDSVPAAIRLIRSLHNLSQESGAGAVSDEPWTCQVLATGSFVLVREVLKELDAEYEE